jgi:hypothetical protein
MVINTSKGIKRGNKDVETKGQEPLSVFRNNEEKNNHNNASNAYFFSQGLGKTFYPIKEGCIRGIFEKYCITKASNKMKLQKHATYFFHKDWKTKQKSGKQFQ